MPFHFSNCGDIAQIDLDAPAAVVARCDIQKVHQVHHNLIRNAVEAAGEGASVQVRVGRELGRALIDVAGDGPGPSEELASFQPFLTTKDGGTGSVVDRSSHRQRYRRQRRLSSRRRPTVFRVEPTVFRVELPIEGPSADLISE